jgi:hypothetical protein
MRQVPRPVAMTGAMTVILFQIHFVLDRARFTPFEPSLYTFGILPRSTAVYLP